MIVSRLINDSMAESERRATTINASIVHRTDQLDILLVSASLRLPKDKK